jgi:chemotaxis protein MotB
MVRQLNKRHKKHEEHEEHADETWLIPYADLLTLLLALFIVLYAMNSVDVKKFDEMSQAFSVAFNTGSGVLDEKSIISTDAQKADNKDSTKRDGENEQLQQLMQKEQQDLEKLKKQVDQYIKTNGLTSQLDAKLNQSQLMITISDNALYSSGEATIKPESRQLASAISMILQQYPDYEIIVAGHTDNQPIATAQFKSNWDLSAMRAIRFMDILLQNKDLDPNRFSAVGHGETRPLDSNSSVAGRATNRRVEVSIIRKYADADKTQQIAASTAKN